MQASVRNQLVARIIVMYSFDPVANTSLWRAKAFPVEEYYDQNYKNSGGTKHFFMSFSARIMVMNSSREHLGRVTAPTWRQGSSLSLLFPKQISHVNEAMSARARCSRELEDMEHGLLSGK